MSETPGGPEHYTPPADAPPPAVPPPPSISDAAEQFGGVAPRPQSGRHGLATTSLVLGVIALVTCWIPGWALLVGVLAIIFGIIALVKGQSRGMSIAGLTTGAIGAIVSLVVLSFILIGLNAVSDLDDAFSSDGPLTPPGPQTTYGPQSENGELTVTEQAFGPMSYDDTTAWFVVIVNNPNDKQYDYANVTINALDASGAVVDTAIVYPSLPAGDSALSGTFANLGGAKVDSLQVTGPGVDGLSDRIAPVLTATNVTSATEDSVTTVTGTVASPDADLTYGAAVTVVARDQSGNIIAAAPAFVDALTKGQSGTFDALFFDVAPGSTTYETYVSAF